MGKTWMDVLIYAVEVAVGLVITVGVPYLFSLLKQKANSDIALKYLDKAEGYVNDAVLMVKQTFVDSLKSEGKFDAEAQVEAFEQAYATWEQMISDEMKNIISETVGDLDAWVKTKIEAAVIESKK